MVVMPGSTRPTPMISQITAKKRQKMGQQLKGSPRRSKAFITKIKLGVSLSCDNDSCRVVNVFVIWISIVSECCPKLCEKGSSLSGFITAEVIAMDGLKAMEVAYGVLDKIQRLNII